MYLAKDLEDLSHLILLRRQQLCHLLHTLRKAEIELLTEPSGKTVQAPRSREAHATIATESLPRAVCPLLQYLEGKMAPYLA